jgi:hypothetical protein
LLATHVIAKFALDRVEEESVNGEIAAFGVFLSVGKLNGFRSSPVLINAVTTESGDLKIRVIFQHINHTESGSNSVCATKERLNLLRARAGSNIVVVGDDTAEHVANAASGVHGLVARVLNAPDNPVSRGVERG